jgi:hypothetical protein
MAIGYSLLTKNFSSTAATSYTTASVTLASGNYASLSFSTQRATSATPISISDSAGGTWISIGIDTISSGGTRTFAGSYWRTTVGTGSSFTITLTSTVAGTNIAWIVNSFSGLPSSNVLPYGFKSTIGTTTANVTTTASLDTGDMWFSFSAAFAASAITSETVGAGWTTGGAFLTTTSLTSGIRPLFVQYQVAASGGVSVTDTSTWSGAVTNFYRSDFIIPISTPVFYATGTAAITLTATATATLGQVPIVVGYKSDGKLTSDTYAITSFPVTNLVAGDKLILFGSNDVSSTFSPATAVTDVTWTQLRARVTQAGHIDTNYWIGTINTVGASCVTTVTYNTITAKVLQTLHVRNVTTVQTNVSTTTTGTVTSPTAIGPTSFDSPSANANDLILTAIGTEYGNNTPPVVTYNTSTTNGNWQTGYYATIGVGLAGIAQAIQYKYNLGGTGTTPAPITIANGAAASTVVYYNMASFVLQYQSPPEPTTGSVINFGGWGIPLI